MSENPLLKVERKARKLMEGLPGSHDWSHVERVRRLAILISKAEGADLEVVEAAALLHDIGRKYEYKDPRVNHADKSAELARPILEEAGFPPEKVDHVLKCIRGHRFRRKCELETLEEKIIYDADKLDSIGAIGVARAFMYGGENQQRLYPKGGWDLSILPKVETPVTEFIYKLSKILDTLHTETSRRIGRERHQFMVSFYKRLLDEVEGRR